MEFKGGPFSTFVIRLMVTFLVIGCSVSLPMPEASFEAFGDIPISSEEDLELTDSDDSYSYEVPQFDLQSLKSDFHSDPLVSSISSRVQNSLQLKGDSDLDGVQLKTATSISDEAVLTALADLAYLAKMLEINLEYIETRKLEDPLWPSTLASKVGSKIATEQEGVMFLRDLDQAVTGIVIMKLMEDRVTFINKYVQSSLSAPDIQLAKLFGSRDSVEVVQGLLALKYLEGFLHAANTMISEAMTNSEDDIATGALYSSFLPVEIDTTATPSSIVAPYLPLPTDTTNDENDFEAGVGAFILLIFTAIGFFFVLFVIIYAAVKTLQKCYEGRSSGKANEKGKNRSKYEPL